MKDDKSAHPSSLQMPGAQAKIVRQTRFEWKQQQNNNNKMKAKRKKQNRKAVKSSRTRENEIRIWGQAS